MAKKKTENQLTYLQMPLPTSGKYSRMTKTAFGGLNKRYTIDSGELSMERNISTNEYPYLTPSELPRAKVIEGENGKNIIHYLNEDTKNPKKPISMFAFDNFILVVYRHNTNVLIDYITEDNKVYSGILKENADAKEDNIQRSIVQFNVYDTPTDPLTGQFVKKLLIFPDKKSMDFEITKDGFKPNNMDSDFLMKEYDNGTEPYLPPDTASHNYYYKNTNSNAKSADTLYGAAIYKWVDDESDSENSGWKISMPPTMPNIKYATVHLSRLFGVDDDRVYASGYNDYSNWNLDTVDEYNEANSWCSPSQANTKAGGKFTGITTFQNHVICFKKDFMHEIYNTKNPFRLQDIYAEGTIDNRTIQDVDGKLIFVSEDDVKVYTGSNPRIIGYNLNMPQYTYAVSGTDNRNYYLYCEYEINKSPYGFLYVYDTYTDMWSEQKIYCRVLSFAHNKNGMYMLCEDGYIYQMDTGEYKHTWSFETDLITNKTVSIKHIKRLQMLVDIPTKIGENSNYADDNNGNPYIKVYALYDDELFDENKSHLVYSSNGKTGKFPIRVKPRNTANYGFKLHFECAGYVKLHELEIFVESGGDLIV